MKKKILIRTVYNFRLHHYKAGKLISNEYEITSRECVLEQVLMLNQPNFGFESHCIFHLDGSIGIRFTNVEGVVLLGYFNNSRESILVRHYGPACVPIHLTPERYTIRLREDLLAELN